MLNHIILMGRLVRDPELRRTQSGTSVCSFTLACDRDYKKDGDKKDTDFIDCVAWRATAEFLCKYFTKGRIAVVSGRLQIRDWTDKDGGKRRSAEVVAEDAYFGDSKNKNNQEPAEVSHGGSDSFPGNTGSVPPGFVQGFDPNAFSGGDAGIPPNFIPRF